jgi:lipopolysaccharide export system permease protein
LKILERYALRQFIPPFFLAIVVLVFVLLMDRLFLLADLLVRKGVAPMIVGEIMVLSLPFVASICTPLGSLIAGVVAFGRMAQDNEVRVVRAAGIHLTRLFVPIALFCTLLMAVMAFFNGWVVPEAQHRARNLMTDVARKRPALRVREGVFMDDFPGYSIYIGTIEERQSLVKNVAIFENRRAQPLPGFVTAPSGQISYTPDDRYMILTLDNGEMHEAGEDNVYRRLLFKRHIINIPMDDDLVRRDREYRSDEEMAVPQLLGQVRRNGSDVDSLAAELRRARQTPDPNEAEKARQDEMATRLKYRRLEQGRFEVEMQKRASIAFSAFFFALFGVPVGLLLRRGGVGTGFIVGLAFFAVYYVLLLAGQNIADAGKVSPFIGMWLPNLILVLPVAELFSRAFYERSLFFFLGRR